MYSFAPCSRDPMMGKASGSPAPALIGREDIEGASWKVNKEQRHLPTAVCLGNGLEK